MKVIWKNAQDAEQLRLRIAEQTSAKQRDRYRVVLIAGEGLGEKSELQREEIAAVVGRSRQFVDSWVGRYRSGGIEALVAKRQRGNKPALTEDQQKKLCELLDGGPTPEEGLAAYNGPIIKQKIEELFGKTLTLGSVYRILHRLGYNDLMPRTTHPDSSPEAMEAFKKSPSRTSGSAPRRTSRQENPELLPGWSAFRPTWNDHPRVGQGEHASACDSTEPVRLSLRLQRGVSGQRPGHRPVGMWPRR
jgi:transposase